jgi:hypothetical protein
MTDIQRITFDEVVLHFAELEDPRSTVNRQHPLVSVVVIALMAVLAGANGPTAIARWAALKEEFLLDALDLHNGILRKDVFRRVLMARNRPVDHIFKIARGLGRMGSLAQSSEALPWLSRPARSTGRQSSRISTARD